jgi:hypothetical protein
MVRNFTPLASQALIWTHFFEIKTNLSRCRWKDSSRLAHVRKYGFLFRKFGHLSHKIGIF